MRLYAVVDGDDAGVAVPPESDNARANRRSSRRRRNLARACNYTKRIVKRTGSSPRAITFAFDQS
jgi:hypothetical protein